MKEHAPCATILGTKLRQVNVLPGYVNWNVGTISAYIVGHESNSAAALVVLLTGGNRKTKWAICSGGHLRPGPGVPANDPCAQSSRLVLVKRGCGPRLAYA